MNLATFIANEQQIDPQAVLLLRHGKGKTDALRRAGASLDEYSLVQPTNTRYDYLATDRPPIRCVVVIVDDHVQMVYRIEGIEAEGTTYSLTSEAYIRFDTQQGNPPVPARRFLATRLTASHAIGKRVSGWSSPRTTVARHGGVIWDRAEI